MAHTKLKQTLFLDKSEEGRYLTVPFDVPENVETITVSYDYPSESSCVDLGLLGIDNRFIGASGSDRRSISVSEYRSSDGYARVKPESGRWAIIAGAYHVADEGVTVEYEIEFIYKSLRLYKGDLHMHTVASDGALTVEEVASSAMQQGLDFIFITDHNNVAHNSSLPAYGPIADRLSVFPGSEWTHYKGHAGLLGVQNPYDRPFFAGTPEEAAAILKTAHEKSALVVINHPFDGDCGWQWGFDGMYFDCIEAVNAFPTGSDLHCLTWWHHSLCEGKRIPIVAGSDFHRPGVFMKIGTPTSCVYAMSRGLSDILCALKAGHSYLTLDVEAPVLEMSCATTPGQNPATIGDTVYLKSNDSTAPVLDIKVKDIKKGDNLKVITKNGVVYEKTSEQREDIIWDTPVNTDAMFYRVEVTRIYAQGMPALPVLISNPVYVR